MYVEGLNKVTDMIHSALNELSIEISKKGSNTDINEINKFISKARNIKKKFALLNPGKPFMRLHLSVAKSIRQLTNIANTLDKSIKKRDAQLFNKAGRMMMDLAKTFDEANRRIKEFHQ